MVKYELDPAHTNIGFTAKHLAVATVHGQFSRWEGHFEGPDDDLTRVRGTLKVEVASLSTRNDQRDTHLRSADFFDAEKYPYMTFKVTGIEKVDEDDYKLRGELTIKDITRPVELSGTIEGRLADPWGGKERLGVSATGLLNRMDFGLNWDGLAGTVPFASHQIKLAIDAEIIVKAAEAAAA
jgi:polyisoprenoid-binding protein YceI